MSSQDKTKICSDCKQEYPVTKEYWGMKTNGRPISYCRPCIRTRQRGYDRKKKAERPEAYQRKLARHREWLAENKHKERQYYLKHRWNITLEGYDSMLDLQQGVCGICQSECSSGYSLAVDHDHETGDIRGLLCANCNTGLGKFKDSVKLLEKAAEYLRK